MSETALEKAVRLAGGQSALATKIGLKQAHVWNWLNSATKRVPAEHVIAIERATEGLVSRHELRPDIYPLDDQYSAASTAAE